MEPALAWLWARLHQPVDQVHLVRALLGLDEAAARQLLARLLLASDEAAALVEAGPGLLRSLRNQQGTVVRTEASIRGPVLWSATISHRAASGFQDDLYVCATAVRDYDLAENRALVAALAALRQAGRLLDALPPDPADAERPALRARGRRAAALAGHPRLRDVPGRRPTERELARARRGAARRTAEPALALLDRAAAGPGPAALAPWVDADAAAHHQLLRLVVEEVEQARGPLAPLRTWRGQLFSGHLRYVPPSPGGGGPPGGVALDDLVFALPGAAGTGGAAAPRPAGHGGRRLVVVTGRDEVRRALAARPDPPAATSTARRG